MAPLLDPFGRYVIQPQAALGSSGSALRPPPPPIKPKPPKPKNTGPKGPGGGEYQPMKPKPKGPLPRPNTQPNGIGSPKANPNAWQDSVYLDQMRLMNKALADYKAAVGLKKTRLGTENAATQYELEQQKGTDLRDIENDFATRGVLQSGVYGQRLGQYDSDYNMALAELARRLKDAETDLDLGFNDYNNELLLQMENAKLDAVTRRAAAIEAGDVPYIQSPTDKKAADAKAAAAKAKAYQDAINKAKAAAIKKAQEEAKKKIEAENKKKKSKAKGYGGG